MKANNKKRNLGLLILRLGTGFTLIAHGYPKLFGGEGKQPPSWLARIMGSNFPAAVENSGPENFSNALSQMNVPYPKASAYASGLAEFGGGIAIVLGLATRLVMPVVIVNMLVAIRKAHWQTGFYGQGGFEFAALMSVIASTLSLTSPGRYSIDRLIRR